MTVYQYPAAQEALAKFLRAMCGPERSAHCQNAIVATLKLAEAEFLAAHGKTTRQPEAPPEAKELSMGATTAGQQLHHQQQLRQQQLKRQQLQAQLQHQQHQQHQSVASAVASTVSGESDEAAVRSGPLAEQLAAARLENKGQKEKLELIEKQDGAQSRAP